MSATAHQQNVIKASRGDRRQYFTVASLAEMLAISERTVREILNRGELGCYRIGPQRRIDPADVDRWLAERREH